MPERFVFSGAELVDQMDILQDSKGDKILSWEHYILQIDPFMAPIKIVGKNPAAVSLGIKGGVRGGPARALKLSAERRSQIAAKAAKTRWDKPNK